MLFPSSRESAPEQWVCIPQLNGEADREWGQVNLPVAVTITVILVASAAVID